ncbi:MAG TPA: hydroxyacid dehydrogenase [Candidatus Acidoferrum sp.]|nr:hydroxyacid dehydrogenase [Candidatus Acidoferrum sp.]
MAVRVLVCDPIDQAGLSILKNAGFDVEENYRLTPDEITKRISEFDALIVRGRTKVTASILSAGTKLKAVARSGVGLDNIDLEAARKKPVQVISTPAAPTTSVAELVIGLILSVLRRIAQSDSAMKGDKWIKTELMGSELKSKTVGIIGAAGRIGFEVARIAVQGFGAKATGYDVIDYRERAKQIGIRVDSTIPELLEDADIVTIHVPYMPSTHQLINEKAIDEMKDGAILINASRGDIVDGQALLKALKAGRLGGAGLDVFHREPPIDEWEKELTGLPNVVCTPHIGAQTLECQRLESITVAQELIKVLGSQR